MWRRCEFTLIVSPLANAYAYIYTFMLCLRLFSFNHFIFKRNKTQHCSKFYKIFCYYYYCFICEILLCANWRGKKSATMIAIGEKMACCSLCSYVFWLEKPTHSFSLAVCVVTVLCVCFFYSFPSNFVLFHQIFIWDQLQFSISVVLLPRCCTCCLSLTSNCSLNYVWTRKRVRKLVHSKKGWLQHQQYVKMLENFKVLRSSNLPGEKKNVYTTLTNFSDRKKKLWHTSSALELKKFFDFVCGVPLEWVMEIFVCLCDIIVNKKKHTICKIAWSIKMRNFWNCHQINFIDYIKLFLFVDCPMPAFIVQLLIRTNLKVISF